MNKTIILTTLFLFSLCAAEGQTIGDDLNLIRDERPGGQVKSYDDGSTYEFHDKAANLTWMYFFGNDSLCDLITIHPDSPTAKKQFIGFLDKEMSRTTAYEWHYKRGDGKTLAVSLRTSERMDSIFIINQAD